MNYDDEDYEPAPMTEDETTERLIAMTNETNIVALDKTMAAIRTAPRVGYDAAADRVGLIGERMVRAIEEIRMTLPPNLRTRPTEFQEPDYTAQILLLHRQA